MGIDVEEMVRTGKIPVKWILDYGSALIHKGGEGSEEETKGVGIIQMVIDWSLEEEQ